jgi:hypothetical protein
MLVPCQHQEERHRQKDSVRVGSRSLHHRGLSCLLRLENRNFWQLNLKPRLDNSRYEILPSWLLPKRQFQGLQEAIRCKFIKMQ